VIARFGYITDDSDLASWQADAIIDHPQQILQLLD
jgi:phosphoglycolate phosphatase-like HAD superfamily hydrolase